MSQEKQATKKAGPPEIVLWAIPGIVLWVIIVVALNNTLLQDNSWAWFLLPLFVSVFYVVAAIRKLGQSNFAGALMFWGAWLVCLAALGFCLNTFLPKAWEAPWFVTTAAVPVIGLVVSVILRFTGFFQQFVPQPKQEEKKEDGKPVDPAAQQKEVQQAGGLLQSVIIGMGGTPVASTVDRVIRTDETREQKELLQAANRSDELALERERLALEKLKHAIDTKQPEDVIKRLSREAYGEMQAPQVVETAAQLRAKRMEARGTRIF